MKPLIAAAFIWVFALTGTTTFAGDIKRQGAPAAHHVTEGLGLLLDTPHKPVEEIDGPSTNLA